jgi:hypothetical protein
MKSRGKLKLLQRQVAWHARFCLTIVEDLEEAAHDGDSAAACYLVQAFAASCLTLSHHLWPGGRRITDRMVVDTAEELRASLKVGEDSLLASERIAPLGITIHYTQKDCRHFVDLQSMVVNVDGENFRLRPVVQTVRALWEEAAMQAEKVPRML